MSLPEHDPPHSHNKSDDKGSSDAQSTDKGIWSQSAASKTIPEPRTICDRLTIGCDLPRMCGPRWTASKSGREVMTIRLTAFRIRVGGAVGEPKRYRVRVEEFVCVMTSVW